MACVCVGGGAKEGGDGDKSQHPYILFFEMGTIYEYSAVIADHEASSGGTYSDPDT